MLALLEVAAGLAPSAPGEVRGIAANRQEKLDTLLRILYGLLEDVLVLERGGVRSATPTSAAARSARRRVNFDWIRKAVRK